MNAICTSLGVKRPTPVSYGLAGDAWDGQDGFLQQLLQRPGVKRVADIGGGANPKVSPEQIAALGLEYTVVDIDAGELAKAPDCYRKVAGDVTDPAFVAGEGEYSYDLVFSFMLAEHVRSGEALHRNVFRMLAPGGRAFHFFPTLFAPPFVVNYLIPETLSARLLQIFKPRDTYQNAKFPAHYSWCRGPSASQLARLREIGYEIELYRGFYGHTYYNRIPVVRNLLAHFVRWLTRHPIPQLTSFA